MEDLRQVALIDWLKETFSAKNCELIAMTGDAGFRRYFRFVINNQSYIAVDSPEDKCNNAAFNLIQQRLKNADILVPDILFYDEKQGFYCLADLGDTLLSDQLTVDNMNMYYQRAISILPKVANISHENLPIYDKAFIQLELDIFSEWLVSHYLNITMSDEEKQQLQLCFDFLIKNIISQPQAVMHRDFHSRNLMLNDEQIAVIDFQDAVYGPITYDVVSLLRDCYVKWPTENILPLLDFYIEEMNRCFTLPEYSKEQWRLWFDLTGLQRHVKASGIFARLKQRDNKTNYIKDIPLTLSYIVDISETYSELTFLHTFVKDTVLPALMKKNQEDNQ